MELLHYDFLTKICVHIHEIVSFISGRVPLAIWYPGPFPYTAVVKCFLSSANPRDTPKNHRTHWCSGQKSRDSKRLSFTCSLQSANIFFFIFFICVLPKTGFPLTECPPKAKTWEWSAVTTDRVSSSLVSSAARPIALSNSTASCRAFLAIPAWWPWSILPLKVQQTETQKNKLQKYTFSQNSSFDVVKNILVLLEKHHKF